MSDSSPETRPFVDWYGIWAGHGGVGRDGLIHISKLTDGFVERVEAIVQSGNRVRVEVLEVDTERRRIGLKLLEVLH